MAYKFPHSLDRPISESDIKAKIEKSDPKWIKISHANIEMLIRLREMKDNNV